MIVKESEERLYTPKAPSGEKGEKVATVKEMDVESQPREKALRHGVGVLSLAELLAIILRTGLTGYPITEICRDLMRVNDNSLHTLERRTHAELLKIRGVGPTKALQLEAILELIRRYCLEKVDANPIVRSAKDIAELMRPRIGNLAHEEIWVICLNQRLEATKISRISSGGTSMSVFDIKLIMKEAILDNASALALCHNHPSGNLRPSTQDDNITHRLAEACKALDLRLVDHVIVTATDHYSYSDNSRL